MSDRTPFTARTRRCTAAAAVGLLSLTACGTGGGGEGGSHGDLEVPLSWIKTAEFGGFYFAEDQGYYEEAGFDAVNLVSGGPSATPSATQIATGEGLVGLSNPIDTGSLIDAEGEDAPIRIIGSVFQRNAFSVFTLGENPAAEPEDLEGMRIGVAPNNEAVFYAFLEVNGIDEEGVEVVSVQGDAQPLLNGEVDAYIGYATNQALSVELEGHDVEHLMFADHGLPFAAGSIIATEEMIEEEPEAIKAFLEASVRGWHDALEDDEQTATVTVEEHGADQGLDFDHQLLTAERQAELIVSEDTRENGLLTMTDQLQADTLEAIEVVGYDVPEDLFDLSLLEEVYEENPDLVEHP